MTRRLRSWIGSRLRRVADRVDYEHAVVCFGGYWNLTPDGIKVTVTDGVQAIPEVPGIPLFYLNGDYDRAFIGLRPGDYGYESGVRAAMRLGIARRAQAGWPS